jgi:hypothetical protein
MSQMKPYHIQKPETRHTIKSTDKSITLFLDDQCKLLIKPKSARYPYPLDSVTVLALANLLRIEYSAIAEEARKFIECGSPGHKSDTAPISGYSGF